MILNDAGKMIEKYWREIPKKYPNIILDAFVIMPNHVHGILIIDNGNVRVPLVGTQMVGTQNNGQTSSSGQPPSSG